MVVAVGSVALGCSNDGEETPLARTEYRASVEAICRDLEREVRANSGRREADATRRAYERLAALHPPQSLADEARIFLQALERAKDDAARLARATRAVKAERRRPGRVREKERLLDQWLAAQDVLVAAQAFLELSAGALGFRAVGGCSAERAPDAGQEIVFVRRADLEPEGIYVIDADGGRPRRLLPAGIAPEALQNPAWSPDGKRLAFVASTPLGGDALWVARANGAQARMVWSGDHAESPTWSPGGERLAFDGEDGLTILELATGRTRVLVTTDPPQSVDVDWSPDGRLLAVGEFAGIALIRPDEPRLPVDSLDARTITGIADRDDVDPVWSPDGRWIAFSRFYYFRRDLPTLHVVRPDGTDLRRVTDGTAIAREPTWSPDGRQLAFTHYPPPTGNELEQDAGEIYVINVDGTGLRRLTHNRVEDFAPDWR